MGIEQRDYIRDSSRNTYRPTGFADMPIVCKRLLIGTVAVFLLQIFVTRPFDINDLGDHRPVFGYEPEMAIEEMPDDARRQLFDRLPRVSVVEEYLALDPQKIKQGQLWRVITYAFCHERTGAWHLIINMLFLYWFGTRLEQMYGSKEFCLFYIAAAIAAGVSFLALDFYTGNSASAIGASGAVWGLVALYVIHHPYERINIYGMFPVEIRWLALIYLVFDLHPVLLAISGDRVGFGGGIAHAAHLGGAAFGFLYFNRSWRLSPLANRIMGKASSQKWTTRTVSSKPRDIIPIPGPDFQSPGSIDPQKKKLEAQLDEVLEKIQQEGRDSLTDEEESVLEQASRQLRSNR